MTRTFVIIIALVAVTIVVISVSLKVFKPSLLGNLSPQSQSSSATNSANQKVQKQNSSASKQSTTNGSVKPPVSLKNPAVLATSITYTFTAKLNEIKSDPKGTILLTNINGIKNDGIPEQFLITPSTIVYFLDKEKQTSATVSDLRVDQTIRIIASYNLSKKKWTTSRVGI